MTRTENQNFSKIYSTFHARDKDNEKVIEYKIQDLPEDRFDEAMELLVEAMKDEPLCVSRNIYENEGTKQEFRRIWTAMLKARLSIGCFTDNGELVGVNALMVKSKGEESVFLSEDKNIRDMIANMAVIHKEIDLFSKFNVDKYLTSLGLCVKTEYRGRGIAKEILKVRPQIMKNIGLTLTVTTFSAVGSQKAAKSVGFEDVFVISYEELKIRSPDFDFVNELSDLYKIMALKI